VSSRPGVSALVSAAPLEKGTAALAARRGPTNSRPALRPNLIARRIVQMGEAQWVVKNPDTTKYYFFEEGNWELAQLFDGTRTLTEIQDLYQSRFPDDPLPMSFLLEFEEALRSMNMLVQSVVERNLQELSWIKDARRRKADQQAEGFNIFLIPFHVFDPDRFLTRTQKYVRWIWRPATVLTALVFIAMMTGVIVQHFAPIWEQTLELYAFLRKPFWDAVQFFVILSGIGLIHELAHAYVCKFYGGDVHDIGVALFYFAPAFYCDTTDTLLFQNKWHRLWVVFAGMYVEAIVCCFATGLWVASYPDTLLHELAYKLMLFTGISTIFFNINPLRKIDGYYALASYLEIPELREDSFEYLSALFKRHVLRLPVEVPILTRRKRRIFLIYAPLAIVFVILLMLFLGGLFYNFYAKYFPNMAGVLLALTLLWLFRTQVRTFLQGVRLVYFDKKELLMSPRARMPLLVGAVALFLVLAIPWAPWTTEAEATLKPWTEVNLEAPDDGTILSVPVHEGDRVQKGELVASMSSPAVVSGLAGAAAQREALRRRSNREREAADAQGVFHSEKRAEAAAMAVAQEENRFERLSIKSPISGRVLTRRTQDLAGRFVPAGAVIARIGDCGRLKAEIPISERLLSYLHPGSPVSLQLKAQPVHILHGSIAQIESAAHELPRTSNGSLEILRPGERPERFVAVVEFDNVDGKNLPGMAGRAKISLGRRSYLWRSWRVLHHWLQTVIWW
jgi:putative peptide zinc metalloprotease protein